MSGDPALDTLGGHRAALRRAVLVVVVATVVAALALFVGFRQDSAAGAAGLGLAGGAVLVAGLAIARGLTRRAPSAAAIAERLGTPLLAALPAPPRELAAEDELVTLALPASASRQRFRRLVADLEAVLPADARSVLVTSPDPGQGKSTTAANVAVELARRGRRVALVDLDRRRPRLHQLFRLFRTPGIAEMARREADLGDCLVPIDLAVGTRARHAAPSETAGERLLHVLPAGAAGRDLPDGEREAFERELIRDLERDFAVVLVDGPPLLHVAEGGTLGSLADATVVVTGIGTDASALAETVVLLEGAGAHRLGCVVTAARTRSRRYREEDYYEWTPETAAVERETEPVA
jgi:Mrp family chromosome partitioning ATPase